LSQKRKKGTKDTNLTGMSTRPVIPDPNDYQALAEFLEPYPARLPAPEYKLWDDEQVLDYILKNVLTYQDLPNGVEHPLAKELRDGYHGVRGLTLATREELEANLSMSSHDINQILAFSDFFAYLDNISSMEMLIILPSGSLA
jgi:hypothetical protein